MELFLDALLDALIDGVKMLPFLYLAYLLIEWLERHHGESIEGALAGGGRWGFIPGALLGCVPQCGFSAVASNLYASRVITPGTLLAVFIATSDEAIPLLAAEPSQWVTLVLLLACKVAFAIVGGWLLDIPLRHVLPHSLYGGYEGHADDVDCHEEHEESSSIFMAALRHTLEIFVFILLFSFIISLLFEGFGEEPITAALSGMGIFQPMLTALVGLVPNCAVSVLLAQLYVQLRQPVRRPDRRCGRRPGCALARQPQLEAESFHDRPALGRRRCDGYAAAAAAALIQKAFPPRGKLSAAPPAD